MNFFKKIFATKEQTQKHGLQCFKCGKRLQLGGGTFIGSGSDLVSHMSNYPYNCKSCGTAFCVDCMSGMKKGNRRCAYCNNDIGW